MREYDIEQQHTPEDRIRGFLLDRGITFAKGPANLRNNMAVILEDRDSTRPAAKRDYTASANAATAICAGCSFTVRAPRSYV